MGVLWCEEQGRVVSLGPRNVVGRGPEASVRLSHRLVSGVHALLTWREDVGWQVRELGSRNGTWIDGARLGEGDTRTLAAGDTLDFGGADERWTLRHAGAPGPVGLDANGQLVAAEEGMLVLPGEDDPAILVFEQRPGRWIAEVEGLPSPCDGDATFQADGQAWRVLLPASGSEVVVPTTWNLSASARIEAIGLRLVVSRDEEHVDVFVQLGPTEHALRARVHHFLLLALARARIADEALDDLAPGEVGWRYTDELCRQLQVTPRSLNLHLVRLRKQLATVGVEGAANVIERRALSGQMRLAVARVSVQAS